MLRRTISLFLSVLLVISCVPAQVFAETLPEETIVPEITAPVETVPAETVSEETMPEETVLETSAAAITEPVTQETAPLEIVEETVAAPAVNAALNGTCGNLTWTLDNAGTLTISGSGYMVDYSSNNTAPWFAERLRIKTVVISSGVTDIGSYAFYYCNNLTSVTIEDTVTHVGSYAFQNCTALKSITLPNNVTQIGNYAFGSCTALESVSLSNSLKTIYNSAFSGCTSLTGLEIPGSVTNIYGDVFSGCTSLKAMTLPSGVKSVASSLFHGCTALERVELKGPVTSIGSYAFSGCSSLRDFTIPGTVTSIGSYAFSGCRALTKATLPGGLAEISSYTFQNCTGLTEIEIPKSVVTISYDAFQGCSGLQTLTLHEGLVTIGSGAFENCISLTAVDLPDTVSTIGSEAFYGCTALKSISIPGTVKAVNSRAFYQCTGLETVTINAGVQTIGESAFSGCTALSSLALPATLTAIGSSAFYGCTALESVDLPEGLIAMDYSAFHNCTSLTSVTLREGLTTIGNSAFYGCSALESIDLPKSLTAIGSSAFYNCDSLEEILIQEGVASIGFEAFYSCDLLESVSIPATVTTIDYRAFAHCPKLTEISFGHTAEDSLSLGNDAFYHYDNYKTQPTTVYVPYARNIHPIISGYPWAEDYRTVTYKSSGYLPATSIAIGTHPAELEVGLTLQLTATAEPAYTTSELEWSVRSNTGRASITADGVLTALAPGFVTIICKSSDNAAVCDESQIEIKKATGYVESIIVRCDGDFEAEVELGAKVQMIADIYPGNAMDKSVVWSVENGSGTATITDKGVLTGLTCGKVTVFAMAKDGTEVMGSRVVEILRYVTDIDLLINGSEGISQLGVDEQASLTAVVSPENASKPTVTWKVEPGTGKAQIERSNGNSVILRGVSAGTVTLVAISGDSRRLTVSRELEIVGEKMSIAVGGGNLYYNSVTGTILGCDEGVTSANIPGIIKGTKITSIAPYAFYNMDNLTSVTIPSSVERIGNYAFHDCDNLASLKINGNGLKYIGDYAFQYNYELINLTIPASVEYIGQNAFASCTGLTTLVIPEGIDHIGKYAFYNLNNLTSLTIPGNLDTTNILSCNTLDTVTFTGTTVLPQHRETTDEHSWHIDTMPGRNAKHVIFADTITAIGSDAFHGKDIETISFGSGLKHIGDYAFQNCDKLQQVTLGPNVLTIGESAFESCEKLKTVVLPEGIKTIGKRAFSSCFALESINLPDSITSLGERCFQTNNKDSSKLQLIDLSGNPAQMTGQEMQLTCKLPTALVKGAGSKAKIRWQLVYTEENPNPYEIAHVDNDGILYAQGVGTVTVMCMDEYTGMSGTCDIEIASGIVITAEGNQNMIVSGETLQLYAFHRPGDKPAEVTWSIREQDREYASITNKGKVTARAVTAAQQIQVTAYPHGAGEPVSMMLWIVPRTTGLYIYEGDADVTGTEMDVDMAQISSLQLTAVAHPEGAMDQVSWVTSSEKVASVDEGLVTFNEPGTVTISVLAEDGSGKSASVMINVTFRDTAKTLTAVVDVPDYTLEAGETAQMLVYGSDPTTPLDIALLKFSVPTSQEHIATVDHTGMITAGETPGKATITAELRDDPMKRSVKVTFTVLARQTERLILRADPESPAQVQMLDEVGNITGNPDAAASYTVLLKGTDVESSAYQFIITPEAFHSAGSFRPEKNGLKWASSNTKIATVAVNDDGTATVTVKQGASGACVISAVTTDAAKVENRLTLNVRDFYPRLETLKPTLNTNLAKAAVIGLMPSYGNDVVQVTLWEGGQPSERLTPQYENGSLTIITEKFIPDGNLPMELKVTCDDGITYVFALSARVKNTAPSVSVQQSEKINLFYSDSTAVLNVQAKEGTVAEVYLADTNDFTLVEYDQISGQVILTFSQDYIIDHSSKPDTAATLLVYLEGYSQPVKVTFTIGTQNKKPSVQTSVKSSVVNTALSEDKTASFGFQLKGSTELLDLANAQVDVIASFADAWVYGDELMLTLTSDVSGSAVIQLQLDNWMEPISLIHKVTVSTKAPTLKFTETKLELNNIFTEQTASAGTMMSQSNIQISSIRFEPAAKAGTPARAEAEKLTLEFDPSNALVTARITDPDKAPQKGTYVFQAYATLSDGNELAPVNLKVNVAATAPKLKLSNSTLKLNRFLQGAETAAADVTMNMAGYTLTGFDLADAFDVPVALDLVEGQLTAFLLEDSAELDTHSVKLIPRVLDKSTGQEVSLPTALTVKIQVYHNEKLSVSLSKSGKLDAIDPASQILYTISKITNACGEPTDVTLEGNDADLFEAELNADGTVSLKLLPGEVYSPKQTYKVEFAFTICGETVYSSVQSFKVSQSVLKFTQSNISRKLYQSQTMPLSLEVTLDTPENAVLESIELGDKTNASFLDAMGSGTMDVQIAADGRSAVVELDVQNPSALAAGKSYVLYLDAYAEGSMENAKPAQIKVTVTVEK